MLAGKGVSGFAPAPAGVTPAAGHPEMCRALGQGGGTVAALSPSALGWLSHCSDGDVSLEGKSGEPCDREGHEGSESNALLKVLPRKHLRERKTCSCLSMVHGYIHVTLRGSCFFVFSNLCHQDTLKTLVLVISVCML